MARSWSNTKVDSYGVEEATIMVVSRMEFLVYGLDISIICFREAAEAEDTDTYITETSSLTPLTDVFTADTSY